MSAGNPAAITADVPEFADLVREHQAMVFSLAYHFLHDRAAAEEVAQDVFVELHRHLKGLHSGEHVLFWLRKVAISRSVDACRRRQRRREVPLDEASSCRTQRWISQQAEPVAQ